MWKEEVEKVKEVAEWWQVERLRQLQCKKDHRSVSIDEYAQCKSGKLVSDLLTLLPVETAEGVRVPPFPDVILEVDGDQVFCHKVEPL